MTRSNPARRRRRSVAARVIGAYALVTVGFAATAGWSVWAQRNAARDAAAMRGAYLPLALALRDLVAAQDTYNAQLNHITAAENPADKRVWFETALQVGRPKSFAQVREALSRAFIGEGLSAIGQEFLQETKSIEQLLGEDSSDLGQLFAALDGHDATRAESLRDELVNRGLQSRRQMAALEAQVQRHLDRLLDGARARERWAMRVLVVSTLFTILIGVAVVVYVRRLLEPLGLVTARAKAVAGGDLKARSPIASNDELGELSATFENMVQAIARANQELLAAERLATVGKMAAHVTHEIRNPLSSLALNLELLEEELEGQSQEARGLQQAIRREIDRLTALSERYLSVARRSQPQLEEEDLERIVRETLESLRSELERHKVHYELAAAESLPSVLIDEGQIRQVLFNLIRNAREAMPEGGTIRVSMTTGQRDSASELSDAAAGAAGIVLAIDDEGQGIDAATRERLFEPFFTTKSHGTGLGLVIIREIVEAHSGQVSCEPLRPSGTRFRVWLPRAA